MVWQSDSRSKFTANLKTVWGKETYDLENLVQEPNSINWFKIGTNQTISRLATTVLLSIHGVHLGHTTKQTGLLSYFWEISVNRTWHEMSALWSSILSYSEIWPLIVYGALYKQCIGFSWSAWREPVAYSTQPLKTKIILASLISITKVKSISTFLMEMIHS